MQFKNVSKIALILGLAALLAITPAAAAPLAQDNFPANTISVSGIGQASGAPDVAYIQIGSEVKNANLGQGITESNQLTSRIIEAIKAVGVEDKDIQTSTFNVWPEELYDPQTGQPSGQRLYHVQNILNVTVRNISLVSKVMDGGVAAGANSLYGLTFGIADTTQLEQEARVAAMANARARAEQLAQIAGVKLGDILIVSETFGSGVFPVDARMQASGGGGVPIQQGQLSISVQVNVTFSISR